jgi:two-component system osmolarity sensor histidine kinase EnvZ
MKSFLDSVFTRLAAMTIGLIVVVHFTGLFMVDRERGVVESVRVMREVSLAEQAHRGGSVTATDVESTLGMTYIAANQAIARGCPAPCINTSGILENQLRRNMPSGSSVVKDERSGAVWIRNAQAPGWFRLSDAALPNLAFEQSRATMLLLAIAAAVIGAWQLQRPLHRLAHAAREFRLGHSAPHVRSSGPKELKSLIGDFNQMVHELAVAEQERAVMLAGVAHDLRTPITRIQVRADMLQDEANRVSFLRDTDSLSRIVTQFLDFARESRDPSPMTGVDLYCLRNYHGDHLEDELMTCNLAAGEAFVLPMVDLERIMSNLIENALTYGDPPVEISTGVEADSFVLKVRDHGGGILESQLERALQPFVRLDEARTGTAHCGLGLAIVRRLVRYNGGALDAHNAVDGGLQVKMSFPIRA